MKKIYSNFHQRVPIRKFKDYLRAEQTNLALEATHLSWIRTTLVMILAGLCISKGAQLLFEAKLLTRNIIIQSSIIGIVLVVSGTVFLTVITFHFLIKRRQLAQLNEINSYTYIPLLLISVVNILVGFGLSYLVITS